MSARGQLIVINDDPVQLRLMARTLEGAGHEVRSHLGAEEALAGLAARPDVDLFVVDLHMPGIDGWKLCRLLRSPDFPRFNGTPILVVSATFTGADVEAITHELGANAFLSVPYERDRLLSYVADLLAGERPQSENLALIVEDDAAVRGSVAKAFEAHGFTVLQAAGTAEAREVWSCGPADVVILDYHLPDGTCEELLSEFKGPASRTVALVMTGDTDPSLPVSLLGRGADAYVRKPFDPLLLVELAGKSQRERSLLRVESILETRTRELKESERRYRSLFETIPDLVMVTDESDRVVQVNTEALRRLGRERSELEGNHVLELVPPEIARELMAHVDRIKAHGLGSFETRLVGAGTDVVDVEATGVTTEYKGSPAVLLVARDLSERRRMDEERKRLEQQVQHTQRLESLGVLAGGIAHDFNNLLVGILGNASLALLDAPDEGNVRECIHQIETAARRAAELTQQILTFSGKGKVVTREVDLSDVVREMGQLLEPAVSKKARMSYRLARSLPAMRGDSGQLRQVVMNLIMNASDSLEGKPGTISVETGSVHIDAVMLRTRFIGDTEVGGRFVYLDVSDDGCGMDEQTRHRMFDPFFTTKFTGRGLGLAATLGIVRAHKGAIRVESAPGKGTRFRLLFPAIAHESDGESDRADHATAPWRDGGKILVADDEPAVRNLARAALRRAGFEILEAENGRVCLDVLAEHDDVDLVLLDLMMPELDGQEVLRSIRTHAEGLPVLLSSGYGKDVIDEEILGSGPTDFIRKPYAPPELVDRISALLRARRSRAWRSRPRAQALTT